MEFKFNRKVNKKDVQNYGDIIECRPERVTLSIPRDKSSKVITDIMNKLPVEDISVHEKSMEDIVSDIFTQKKDV